MGTTFTRREAIKSALTVSAVAGLPFAGVSLSANAVLPPIRGASIARAAIAVDTIMLAAAVPDLSDGIQLALTRHYQHALGAGALAGVAELIPAVIADCGAGWAGRDGKKAWVHRIEGDMLEHKLAAAAGWMIQRGAATALFPDGDDDGERGVYYDAATIHSLSSGAGPSSATGSAESAIELLDVLRVRTLISMHTLDIDILDIEEWMDRYLEWNDSVGARHKRLAAALRRPDPARQRVYLQTPTFFDPSDPLVALGREVTNGLPASVPGIRELIAKPGKSRYALAVAAALEHVRLADQVFRGGSTPESLRSRLS